MAIRLMLAAIHRLQNQGLADVQKDFSFGFIEMTKCTSWYYVQPVYYIFLFHFWDIAVSAFSAVAVKLEYYCMSFGTDISFDST